MSQLPRTTLSTINAIGGHLRLGRLVESMFHSPFITIASIPEKYSVTYPTAKADVEKLVYAGILEELPDTKVQTYYAPEVFRVAYEELES